VHCCRSYVIGKWMSSIAWRTGNWHVSDDSFVCVEIFLLLKIPLRKKSNIWGNWRFEGRGDQLFISFPVLMITESDLYFRTIQNLMVWNVSWAITGFAFNHFWRIIILWDKTLCSPLKVNWRLGGKYRLHLQGRRINEARKIVKAHDLLTTFFRPCFFLGLFLDPNDGSEMFLRNVAWLSTDYTAFYSLWEPQILQSFLGFIYASLRVYLKSL
jgi:hypothetical protein